MTRRLIAAVIVIIVAVSLLYDAPTQLPAAEPALTPGTICVNRYERRGLGWEPWVLVEDCY